MAGGAVVREAEVKDVLHREEAVSFAARMTWLQVCSGIFTCIFALLCLLEVR